MKEDSKGRTAHTPGDTILKLEWEIKVKTKESEYPLKFYALFDEDVETPILSDCVRGARGIEIGVIMKKKSLEAWQEATSGESRDQNKIMGGPAIEKAMDLDLRGRDLGSDEELWNWCHLVAYSMGGSKSVVTYRSGFEDDYFEPQKEENMVLGTRQANAWMYIVEEGAKKVVHEHNIDVKIEVCAEFGDELQDLIAPTTVTYTVSVGDTSMEFLFDMRTRRKIFPQMIEMVQIMMLQVLVPNYKLQADLPAAGVPTPASQDKPLFSSGQEYPAGMQSESRGAYSLTNARDPSLSPNYKHQEEHPAAGVQSPDSQGNSFFPSGQKYPAGMQSESRDAYSLTNARNPSLSPRQLNFGQQATSFSATTITTASQTRQRRGSSRATLRSYQNATTTTTATSTAATTATTADRETAQTRQSGNAGFSAKTTTASQYQTPGKSKTPGNG